MEVDRSINKLAPAEFTDEVREIFGSITKAAEQAQMVIENISSFAERCQRRKDILHERRVFPT